MPAIRPEPPDTSFETPQKTDEGTLSYYGQLASDALYHSPVSAVHRWSELHLEENDDSSQLLSPDQANKNYGLDGEINFDEPIRERAAGIIQQRRLAEDRRQYLLQSSAADHWGRKISGFGVSMAAQLLDPVNLASMFIPVVGEEQAIGGIARATSLLRSGLISSETFAKIVGPSVLGQRLAKGALEGFVGQSLVRPTDIVATLQEKGDYSWGDEFKSLAVGAAMGAGLHATLGFVGDRLKSMRGALTQITPETHEANVLSSVADLMKDEHVSSPEKITSVDPEVVNHNLEAVNNDDIFKIANDLKKRLQDMRDAGVKMTPIQASKMNAITTLLHEPVYAGYKTANELAKLMGLRLDPDAEMMPKQFQYLLSDAERSKLVQPSAEAIQSKTQESLSAIAKDQINPSAEKTVDTPLPSDKSSGVETVQKKPEPVNTLSEDEMKQAQSQLQEEASNWEKQTGDLTPEEQKIVDKAVDPEVTKSTSAVQDGINCILNKAI